MSRVSRKPSQTSIPSNLSFRRPDSAAGCRRLLLADLVLTFITAVPAPTAGAANGLRISRLTPTGGTGAPFDTIELEFSRDVRAATFTVDDVTLTGPAGGTVPAELIALAPNRFELDFTGWTGLATYTLTVGPDILDAFDQPMDQNDDGTTGQADEDAYRALLFAADGSIGTSDTSADGLYVVVSGATVTVDGSHQFAGLAVLGGAMLTHFPATLDAESQLRLSIDHELWVDADSAIDGTGRGYPGGHTDGNTTDGAATGSAGGSYGGLGYDGYGCLAADCGDANRVYGDATDPNDLG
jgi:hypothetical protein